MLPARSRLRERSDFTSVVRGPGGTRAGSRLLVVHATATDTRAGMPPRVGFVVSKAVGGAVTRNRVKRRLRALIASHLASLPQGVDLVVRANPAASSASFEDLEYGLIPLLHKAIRQIKVA
ncbi:MAG TPA: ribonuclease P protein component [Phycicoccus sp.]|nr:ribonuclease P protein component [Phycicoccus sp.]HQH06695.1 ribonuclease P protein component [Phycicoccus sp.]HQK31713.1 ribonuclease P protein component [Phycicoccus sp.]HQV92068.1 ribonuclease P protein component [Phycicoccus sp.]HQY97079.1 ribonuclease P protein component [Phycicoccus sp.]